MSFHDLLLKVNYCLEFTVFQMKMRRIMIVVEHLNYNSVESGNFWHKWLVKRENEDNNNEKRSHFAAGAFFIA